MTTTRRSFIQLLPGIALFPEFKSFYESDDLSWLQTNADITDEDFWFSVQRAYTTSPNIINLNNGGVSPQPKVVQDTFENYNRLSNEAPTYYMWRILDQGREALREALAELAGCDANEIAINRNSTEALVTIIMGLRLNEGDEIVLSKQDYPNMLNAWKWREKRDKIKLVFVDHDLPCEDANELTKRYTSLFTSKTKVVHITHLINWTGQILPCKNIADEAHKKNIEVIIDGAHSFAHFEYKIPELGGDYFGTSLHKWLSAPFGTGMLWVKKDKIAGLPPLFPGDKPESDDIKKFETLGTRSFPTELATGRSIDFHNGIGSKRKAQRLHYLKNYWAEKAANIQGVKIHTSLKPEWAGAVALFSIDRLKPQEIESTLFKEYGIHTVAIDWENIHGVRVTPNVYTSLNDLNKLVRALQVISKKSSG